MDSWEYALKRKIIGKRGEAVERNVEVKEEEIKREEVKENEVGKDEGG